MFEIFLLNPEHLEHLVNINPEFIVVLLGRMNFQVTFYYRKCARTAKTYKLLRKRLLQVIIIPIPNKDFMKSKILEIVLFLHYLKGLPNILIDI